MRSLSHIIKTINNHFTHYRCTKTRPAANACFSKLSEKTEPNHPGSILVEGLWDHPHHWLRLSLLRQALAPLYGSGLIGLYQDNAPSPVIESLRSLKIDSEEVLPSTVPEPFITRAREMLEDIHTPDDILDLEIAPGYPTHFFYDGVLKRELVGTIHGDDPCLVGHLARALFYIEYYNSLFDRHDIRALVVSHPTTIRFSTLLWAAVSRNIPAFVINYRNEHITIRKFSSLDEIGHIPEDVPTPKDRDSLSPELRQHLISIGQEFIDELHKGNKGEISVTGAYAESSKQVSDGTALARSVGGDPSKPNIVILTSCWPDFPNALGRSYFSDHVAWFHLTIEAAQKNPQYNWIIKPHPAEYMYGKKTTLKKLIDGYLGNGVYLWPENVSGSYVLKSSDCVVTALGSVGFEYPALGARSLVSRETAYTSWGFGNNSTTKEEYLDMLSRAHTLPLPSDKEREDALIYIALRLTAPKKTLDNGYQYPWGRISYRLWPDLPKFIYANADNFEKEVALMKLWLSSGNPSYNVFKGLNAHLW